MSRRRRHEQATRNEYVRPSVMTFPITTVPVLGRIIQPTLAELLTDGRHHQPGRTYIAPTLKRTTRPIVSSSPRILPATLHVEARRNEHCLRRKERREVLFADRRAGRKGQGGGKRRFTSLSKLGCK